MPQDYPKPFTPPPELTDEQVGEWLIDDGYPWDLSEQAVITITSNRLKNVARQAAQWGADQELEACCEVADRAGWATSAGNDLRAARRSKPPSLKEQSIALLDLIQANEKGWQLDDLDVVRRALEQLPDD